MTRKPIIAGNWKMNKTPQEAVELINKLKPLVADAMAKGKSDMVVCTPFICLPAAAEALKGSSIQLGAQNMHWEESGAFTGEISPGMLKSLGVSYVIIGHSERRQYFAETNDTVNKKVKAAFAHDLIPIICVGETLEQRESGVTKTLVEEQTKAAFQGLTAAQAKSAIIAYEPIWAIGTGLTASPEDANEVVGYIRATIAELFPQETAKSIRIQYGGSMKPANVADLMAMPEIDGGLIGGASLTADDFSNLLIF